MNYPFPLTNKNKFPSNTTASVAHPYDKTQPRKYWADPNALVGHQPLEPYAVQVVDATGALVTACTITCQQAATYNIDGTPGFAAAAVAPDDISLLLNGGQARALIAPNDLIREEDLATLTAKIKVDTGVTPSWTAQAPLVDTGSGGAATWKLYRAETTQTAGSMWNQQCALGEGWPGKWSHDPMTGYTFQWDDPSVFSPDPNAPKSVPIPCPMNPLLPTEELGPSTNPMNPGPFVYLKQTASSGNSTDSALIAQIAADVAAIKTRLGVK